MSYKILVIDDQLFRDNSQKKSFCKKFGLEEIDESNFKPTYNLSKRYVKFIGGQKEENGIVKNDNEFEDIKKEINSHYNIKNADENSWIYSAVLLDLRFATGRIDDRGKVKGGNAEEDNFFGFKILEILQKFFPLLPVAIISDQDSDKDKRDIIKKGRNERRVQDYISKNITDEENTKGKEKINNFLNNYAIVETDPESKIYGKNINFLFELSKLNRMILKEEKYILFLGEKGTGKSALAEYCYNFLSFNKYKNGFIKKNLKFTTDELAHTLLFGHKKGVFTGASEDKKGLFEEMKNNSTIFLDELGNVSQNIQYDLLTFLDDGYFYKLGEDKNKIEVDHRIIFATNKEYKIIDDLYDRIAKPYPIRMIPLRERKSDILYIVQSHIKDKHESEIPLDTSAKDYLLSDQYDWPGNYRELTNVIDSIFLSRELKDDGIIFDGDIIQAIDQVRKREGYNDSNDGQSDHGRKYYHIKNYELATDGNQNNNIHKENKNLQAIEQYRPNSLAELLKLVDEYKLHKQDFEVTHPYDKIYKSFIKLLCKLIHQCYESEKFKMGSGKVNKKILTHHLTGLIVSHKTGETISDGNIRSKIHTFLNYMTEPYFRELGLEDYLKDNEDFKDIFNLFFNA